MRTLVGCSSSSVYLHNLEEKILLDLWRFFFWEKYSKKLSSPIFHIPFNPFLCFYLFDFLHFTAPPKKKIKLQLSLLCFFFVLPSISSYLFTKKDFRLCFFNLFLLFYKDFPSSSQLDTRFSFSSLVSIPQCSKKGRIHCELAERGIMTRWYEIKL